MTNTATLPTASVTFTVGTIVDTGAGDYRWTFEVVARSAKFVTLRDITHGDAGTDTYRVGVKHSTSGPADAPTVEEYALPFGSYSMAPVVRPVGAR